MSSNIGSITLRSSGTYVGRIETLQVAMTIALRPVVSPNPKAPKFDVMALNAVAKVWVKVGALFALTSNSTGEEFLNGRIDDPSLSEPIQVSAFRQEDGSYNIVWQRQQRRAALPAATGASDDMPPLPLDEGGPANGATGGEVGGGHTDGLGSSTAPDAPENTGKGRSKRELVDA
ncbi:DUF736 domain-containing protein [Sphingomonas sp. SUN039]|uniref:DUF736 domain-containing protein n=1 Tax=Sphingomonas sp. SUN039 TaxID=2937787 RepID=UPI002164652A|nr:DUF736 domain-containing protein [Sphingomonas sp. SUN039]UVO53724.1 DUF736 domain-containing protein [Sphingomonas sp. SUN039]